MDANKREVLVQIGYKVEGCSLCLHGNFRAPTSTYGTCNIHQYDHQKHTGPARDLSVHRCGRCPKFEVDPKEREFLNKFQEFLP